MSVVEARHLEQILESIDQIENLSAEELASLVGEK
jgi:hypothetical protein